MVSRYGLREGTRRPPRSRVRSAVGLASQAQSRGGRPFAITAGVPKRLDPVLPGLRG